MTPSNYTQILIDNIVIPTLVIDTSNFKIVFANKAARDQIIGKDPISEPMSCCHIFSEKENLCNQTKCFIWQVISTKAPVRIVHSRHWDGIESIYEIILTPIFNENGEISQATMTIYDITTIKRTEESLKLFRYLIDESNDGILIVDPQTGCFLDVNNKICTDLGYTREELLNMGILDIETGSHASLSSDKFVDDARKKNYMMVEGLYQRKDNSIMLVEVSLRFLTHEKKEYMVCIVRDITERKRADEELRTANQKLMDIIEFLPDATFVIDSEKKVIAWNRAIEEMTGVKKEKILGKGDYAYAFPLYKERRPVLIDFVLHFDTEFEHKYYFVEKRGNILLAETFVPHMYDGKGAYLWVVASPLFDSSGNQIGAIESIRNITERKRAEDNLKKYAEELEHSNELKDLFTDIMHHDLLNPAGIVKGYTEILLDIEKNKKKRHYLETIERSNKKLISIIERASNYAKLASIEDLEFEKRDIASIIKKVIENLIPPLDQKNMTVEFAARGKYYANVNPVIEEVFSNLLCNAIKYSPKESRIIVDIFDAGKEWKVSITDFGVGISDEDKSMLFERFRRLKNDAVKGTGLGLAIVKRLTTLHGGSVGVEDNPEGQGSVFWITLRKA